MEIVCLREEVKDTVKREKYRLTDSIINNRVGKSN